MQTTPFDDLLDTDDIPGIDIPLVVDEGDTNNEQGEEADDLCALGEHEYELVLLDGGRAAVYECIYCGARN